MMEVVMKLARILVCGRFVCAVALTTALALACPTADAAPIDGSANLGAVGATQNGADITASTVFTPVSFTDLAFTMGPNALVMTGVDLDFLGMPVTFVTTSSLDINDGTAFTFTSVNGDFVTNTFDMDTSALAEGFLHFTLTGTFTPKGALAAEDPANAELRISLNQSGGALSWGSSMVASGPPIPEPMTVSILALGGVALLRRRRRA